MIQLNCSAKQFIMIGRAWHIALINWANAQKRWVISDFLSERKWVQSDERIVKKKSSHIAQTRACILSSSLSKRWHHFKVLGGQYIVKILAAQENSGLGTGQKFHKSKRPNFTKMIVNLLKSLKVLSNESSGGGGGGVDWRVVICHMSANVHFRPKRDSITRVA